MTDRRVMMAEEDAVDPYTIQDVRLGRPGAVTIDPSLWDDDPFAIENEAVKSIGGVSANNRRRISNQITKRHAGRDGASSKKIENRVITAYNAFDVVAPPYNLEYLALLYEKNSTHYAAVNAKVSNIVGLGFDLVESSYAKREFERIKNKTRLSNKRKRFAEAKEQIVEIIDSLNEEDTFQETLTKVWKDYEATGNGYIEVGRVKVGRNRGQIGYIGHVPAVNVRVRRERDGFVQIIGNQATYFRNFGSNDPNPLGDDDNPNEIIHIKKYAPSSQFYGVPDIIAAMNAVAGSEFADRYNLDYFENKAVPRHLVILKGATLGSGVAAKLLEFFETGLKGKNHRSLFIPLPSDTPERKVEFKIEPIEAGVQDSSFNNFNRANISRILMAHRVPSSKVAMVEGVSLAIARDADKTFKEQVCGPEQKTLEKKLNRIVREFTDLFVLKLNEMTLTDADTQSKIWERLAKIGAITRNEIRAEQGRPGIEKGDEIIDINKGNNEVNEERASRSRDSERSAGATDSAGEGRNPKGEGRTAP